MKRIEKFLAKVFDSYFFGYPFVTIVAFVSAMFFIILLVFLIEEAF